MWEAAYEEGHGDYGVEAEEMHEGDVKEDEAYEGTVNEDHAREGIGGTAGPAGHAAKSPRALRGSRVPGRAMRPTQDPLVQAYFMCRWPGCLYGATDRAAVAEHYARHVRRPQLVCTYHGCAATFDHPAVLTAHQLAQHRPSDPQLVRCSHHGCPATFHSAAEAQAHEAARHGSHVPACPWSCGAPYADAVDLQHHMLAAHVGAGEPPDWQTSTADHCVVAGGAWGCAFFACGASCDSEEQLDAHCATHIAAPYACSTPGCGQAFALCTQYVRHMRKAHGLPMGDETRLEWHRCCYGGCGLLLEGQKQLRTHMRKHARSNAWPCPVCGAGFPTESQLKAHSLSHWHTQDPCADDPPQADTLPPLQDGAEEEEGPPRKKGKASKKATHQHRCRSRGCGMVLPDEAALQAHMATHRPAKQHCCSVCGAAFPSRSTLHAHMDLHNNLRAFRCDQPGCGAAFNFSSNLRLHRRGVHGIVTPKTAAAKRPRPEDQPQGGAQ